MAQYMYGKNTVLQRLKSGDEIEELYLQENLPFNDVMDLARSARIPVVRKSKLQLNQLTQGNHQGLVAKVRDYETVTLDEIIENAPKQGYPLLVMLDQVEDPHNLGAILRTCDGAGVSGVILGKHRSVGLTPTVAKVSTGAIDTVPVAIVTNLAQSIDQLKKQGYWIVGTDNSERAMYYNDLKSDAPLVLVLGSEGKGISRLVKEKCDFIVKIPMSGTISSLNVSVACGILLYDIQRQRSDR